MRNREIRELIRDLATDSKELLLMNLGEDRDDHEEQVEIVERHENAILAYIADLERRAGVA
jgi:hypothetical protein